MLGMPIELIYLIALLVTIVIAFILFKRPIYEAMFIGYLVMVIILKRYDMLVEYLIKPSTNTLFYAIVAFLSLAYVFEQTDVVKDIINFILSLVGRFRGGAGYVSLLSSTFMAALSGTGPGNVAATGVFTIPAMIHTNFPRALAATVEMSASSLGPMIPPSGT
ncbi:MAG TPA: TRAP transporter large permease subunit, partial [Tepidimicrobium sp.]|nr:TRAP transporter large permease subunit [Tepidimicrobium sp.]